MIPYHVKTLYSQMLGVKLLTNFFLVLLLIIHSDKKSWLHTITYNYILLVYIFYERILIYVIELCNVERRCCNLKQIFLHAFMQYTGGT